MPRQSRKVQARDQTRSVPQPAPSLIMEAPLSDRGEPPPTHRAPTRQTRVNCPVCGFLPEIWRLEDGPHTVNVRHQYFGGSYPRTETEYRRAYMRYVDADPESRLLAAQLMLQLLHDASLRIVSDLPLLYQQAGQDVPRSVQEQAPPTDILRVLPTRTDLLIALTAGDSRIADREDWRGVAGGPRAQEMDARRIGRSQKETEQRETRQLRRERRHRRKEAELTREQKRRDAEVRKQQQAEAAKAKAQEEKARRAAEKKEQEEAAQRAREEKRKAQSAAQKPEERPVMLRVPIRPKEAPAPSQKGKGPVT